jgi:FtsP/CotA-like multicopper oxidase with cupredoxin domain
VPDPLSDIAPIWNPEAFFTTIVVNGVTWPKLEVAPALYRLRLLNGCNSRFLNLALFQVVTPNKNKPALQQLGRELPFYQIGAEQGFLPKVVQIQTGFATPLAGARITNQSQLLKAPNNQQALLMGLAERADVIVDFRGLANGTRIRMINTAPDAPFGGFPDIPADPATTGQVMEFVINSALNGKSPTDPVLAGGVTPNPNAATDPWLLALPAESALGVASVTRNVSLNEEESAVLCVTFDKAGNLVPVPGAVPPLCLDPAPANLNNPKPVGFPMAPKAALLGQVGTDPLTGLPIGIPLKWTDMTGTSTPKMVDLQSGLQVMVNVTENPAVGAIEDWEIYNFTVDAHPIHLHLVRFQVIARGPVGTVLTPGIGVQPWETGFKDTVIAFPGEITKVRAKFDIPGLYVWHCHIVEHEDNEMMRPYFVGP